MYQEDSESQAPASQINANLSKKRSVVLHKDATPFKRGDDEASVEVLQRSRLINADIESLREQREIEFDEEVRSRVYGLIPGLDAHEEETGIVS